MDINSTTSIQDEAISISGQESFRPAHDIGFDQSTGVMSNMSESIAGRAVESDGAAVAENDPEATNDER